MEPQPPEMSPIEVKTYVIDMSLPPRPRFADEQSNKFTAGEAVTRENFIKFYVNSFQVSRGIPPVQMAYFEWYRINQGLDYAQTLENWCDNGSDTLLSPEEKNQFIQYYSMVKGHLNSQQAQRGLPLSESFVMSMLSQDLGDKIAGKQKKDGSFLPLDRLKGMSMQDFLKKSSDYIQERHEAKK